MNFFQKKPMISQLWLNRIFVGVIVFMALVVGYFYTENQKLKNMSEWESESLKELKENTKGGF